MLRLSIHPRFQQEEERERRMDFVPDVSALHQDIIEVDADTKDMVRAAGFGGVSNIQVLVFDFLVSNTYNLQSSSELLCSIVLT